MITIENLLFGFTAGLIGFKVAVLAVAALLFACGLSARRRRLDVRI